MEVKHLTERPWYNLLPQPIASQGVLCSSLLCGPRQVDEPLWGSVFLICVVG